MPKETEKQRILSRRALIFGGVQLAAFTALSSRLFYLQFIRANEYSTLSENNRIKLQLIAPERGIITDRYAVPLAENQKNYRLFIDYSSLKQSAFTQTIEKLHKLVPLTEKRLEKLGKTRVSSASMPEMLKDHLTWEEVSLVELHMLDLPGVYIDVGQIRHYPFGEHASHLIGYVGSVAQSDIKKEDEPLLRLPEFKIGKNGVERMMEDQLRGVAGIRQLEVNVHGVPVREIGNKPSIAGESILLTIDSRLQEFAAKRVKDESASVVVMNVHNGNIIAMASMPGFDPGSFSKTITNTYWKELNSNKKNPLLNKSLTGQYPPGSTYKLMVGLAGMRAGIINPNTSVHCPGHYYLGNHRFNCWKEGGHGMVNFHSAVAQSCDTYFYTAGERIGIDTFAKLSREFGLGQSYDIGLTSEKSGLIPDPEWKMRRYKQRWAGGDTINCSIGQGYVLATPIQLAVMTSRMVNGGFAVMPRIWVPEHEQNPEFPAIDISGDLLETAKKAMSAVCNSPIGTAYGKRIKEERFKMGGKTGTSQVRKIITRGMRQDLLPWEARHHALFIGFAPVDKPKYAISVAIEHGGGGSSAAAPVAHDVLLKIQQLEEEDNQA